jgi:hypothetical protein
MCLRGFARYDGVYGWCVWSYSKITKLPSRCSLGSGSSFSFFARIQFSTSVYPLFAEKLQDNILAVETRTFQMMFGNIQVQCCDFLRLEEQSFQSFYISFPAMLWFGTVLAGPCGLGSRRTTRIDPTDRPIVFLIWVPPADSDLATLSRLGPGDSRLGWSGLAGRQGMLASSSRPASPVGTAAAETGGSWSSPRRAASLDCQCALMSQSDPAGSLPREFPRPVTLALPLCGAARWPRKTPRHPSDEESFSTTEPDSTRQIARSGLLFVA